MTYTSTIHLLALAFYQFMLADAQNCSTSSNAFDNGYNATGSVASAGFRVNASYPESTWTWSQYIVDDYNSATNKSEVWSTIGLQTSPVQNLLDPSLPYTACLIALSGVKVAGNGAADNGSCSTVLTSDCARQIVSQVNLTASQLSNAGVGIRSGLVCPSLLGSIAVSKGSACYGQWDGTFASRFMYDNFTGPLYPSSSCLPPVNPGASNATSRAFFSWSPGPMAAGNYTIYDQKLRDPQPIIVAAFLKEVNNTVVPNIGWADTRLLCLPGNVTAPGSRNITEANKTAGAGRLGGAACGMFGVVVLTALFGLL